ncbi:hypothetical protein PoB_002568200 [Plakobranchus ocellatus]|uniref:Uncharacterized protein n=1 Tax=Plakobranchus ocellatus TaxID=259542 RepID=A0AAV3ZWV9_9GAST|nr:hypothetical protein PoB_002568200 [Plakobranchus ocellatus]
MFLFITMTPSCVSYYADITYRSTVFSENRSKRARPLHLHVKPIWRTQSHEMTDHLKTQLSNSSVSFPSLVRNTRTSLTANDLTLTNSERFELHHKGCS